VQCGAVRCRRLWRELPWRRGPSNEVHSGPKTQGRPWRRWQLRPCTVVRPGSSCLLQAAKFSSILGTYTTYTTYTSYSAKSVQKTAAPPAGQEGRKERQHQATPLRSPTLRANRQMRNEARQPRRPADFLVPRASVKSVHHHHLQHPLASHRFAYFYFALSLRSSKPSAARLLCCHGRPPSSDLRLAHVVTSIATSPMISPSAHHHHHSRRAAFVPLVGPFAGRSRPCPHPRLQPRRSSR